MYNPCIQVSLFDTIIIITIHGTRTVFVIEMVPYVVFAYDYQN